jgi:hypothetical protein
LVAVEEADVKGLEDHLSVYVLNAVIRHLMREGLPVFQPSVPSVEKL